MAIELRLATRPIMRSEATRCSRGPRDRTPGSCGGSDDAECGRQDATDRFGVPESVAGQEWQEHSDRSLNGERDFEIFSIMLALSFWLSRTGLCSASCLHHAGVAGREKIRRRLLGLPPALR